MFESKTTLFANVFSEIMKPVQELADGVPADNSGKKNKKKLKKLLKKVAASAATEALAETMAELKPSKKEKKKAAPASKAGKVAEVRASASAQDDLEAKLNAMVSSLSEEERNLVKMEVLKKTAAIPVQLITAGVILPDSSESEMAEAVMAEAMASVEEWTKEAIDNLRQPAPVQVVDCKVVESPSASDDSAPEVKPTKKVTAERLKQAADAINARRNSRRNNDG